MLGKKDTTEERAGRIAWYGLDFANSSDEELKMRNLEELGLAAMHQWSADESLCHYSKYRLWKHAFKTGLGL
ncbi:MAG: hypothetical protein FWD93_01020 [Coriobacteriia bacterium]|nr:hypothetical protein [Coriobacteriia bacterium]